MIWGCLELYFGCLDLYFVSRTYILTVWTYIFDFWTYISGFGLIFLVLDSYLGVWTSNLGVWTYTLGVRVGSGGSAGSAGSGGRPGRVSSTFGEKSILGICIRKKQVLTILLDSELGVFLQKRRAPKNAAFWRALHAEISHMRLIQGRKLKLFQGSFLVYLALASDID